MRALIILSIIFSAGVFAFGQNEQAPIIERTIEYRDWTYRNISSGEQINLRRYSAGKKLTMVVYYAPWCPNWRYDAPRLQRLYDKYKDSGLGIIAVGLYDPLESMKSNLELLKITFPAVYESADRSAKQTSLHYSYRRATGDDRGWGSPWYIFLSPATLETKGDLLTKKTFIINGEIIEKEGEIFIRKQLGLSPDVKAIPTSEKISACAPDLKIADLRKPN